MVSFEILIFLSKNEYFLFIGVDFVLPLKGDCGFHLTHSCLVLLNFLTIGVFSIGKLISTVDQMLVELVSFLGYDRYIPLQLWNYPVDIVKLLDFSDIVLAFLR